MDRQTLRDWVIRYNEEGLAGLSDRQGCRWPPSALSPEQRRSWLSGPRRGPDLAEHGVVPLATRGPAPGDRGALRGGAGRTQRGRAAAPARAFRRLSVRPKPPRPRPGRASGVGNKLRRPCRRALPEQRPRQAHRALVADEARVGQQGTLTRVWAATGTRPVAPRDCRYTWAYLFGAVCPERGVRARRWSCRPPNTDRP